MNKDHYTPLDIANDELDLFNVAIDLAAEAEANKNKPSGDPE